MILKNTYALPIKKDKAMKEPKDILKDAIEKHNLKIDSSAHIEELVAYVLNIGYNEGWKDSQKKE